MSRVLLKRIISIVIAILILSSVFVAFAEGWICPKCGRENPEKANFCGGCRAERPTAQFTSNANSNAWVCSNCSSVCSDDDSFCIYCGNDHNTNDARALLIESVVMKGTQYPQAEIKRFKDSIKSEQVKTYSYTALVDGDYNLYLEDAISGFGIRVNVYDSKKDATFGYLRSGEDADGFPITLSAGENYTIEVTQSNKEGNYTLCIGIANPIRRIDGIQTIRDSFVYDNQVNRYTFTAPESGDYGIWFSDVAYGFKFHVEIYDALGYQETFDYLGGDRGMCFSLEAGKEYTVYVEQYQKIGTYTFNLGLQTPTVDISGLNAVGDEIYFEEQKNIYRFTAPESGTYTIKLIDADSGLRLRINFYDVYGYPITYMSLTKGDSDKVDFKAINEYIMEVQYYNEIGKYAFSVIH